MSFLLFFNKLKSLLTHSWQQHVTRIAGDFDISNPGELDSSVFYLNKALMVAREINQVCDFKKENLTTNKL
jgi:hypothetical protein